jgi:hypothetical protein
VWSRYAGEVATRKRQTNDTERIVRASVKWDGQRATDSITLTPIGWNLENGDKICRTDGQEKTNVRTRERPMESEGVE